MIMNPTWFNVVVVQKDFTSSHGADKSLFDPSKRAFNNMTSAIDRLLAYKGTWCCEGST